MLERYINKKYSSEDLLVAMLGLKLYLSPKKFAPIFYQTNAGITQPFAVSYDSATFPGYFNLRFVVSSYGWSYWEIDTTIIVKPSDIEEEISLPLAYKFEQNYPNPFNPATTVGFGLPEKGNVRL